MRLSKFAGLSTLSVTLLVLFLMASDSELTAWRENKNRETQNIQTFVLDSFEKRADWKVEFSQFATKTNVGKNFILNTNLNTWRTFEGKPWGVRAETNTNRCLAVKASFDRSGYNWVEVYPVDKDGNHRPLPMVGRVQAMDLWVWGGNFKYRLEIHLEDYKGYRHVVDAGWLNYIGWRNIRLPIPGYIPQGENYVPRLKTLKFAKFVLYAHPAERHDIFYVYFDRMQIQSDVYLERFDGDDLVKEGFQEEWMPDQETLLKK